MDPRPVTLEGQHVRLEPLEPSHAPDLLAALLHDTSIWQWLSTEPPATPAAMEAFIAAALQGRAAGTGIPFAQISRAEGRAVGSTRYLNISRNDLGLEIGWTWIGKPWQRTAINTESKFLLLRHAFEDLGAARVQFKTDARNLQSQAAIARLGAVREGVLRKYQRTVNDFIRDTVMFSIVADEWPEVKTRLLEKLSR
ncbi:GNAT family N-acetyltransferase [Polyangium aurulentum]|uniref:GNAT family N-acetyltransferase n=1 Tax=Polyangium aurulentum TaxID=2567896 RepID=UPI0010AE821E|nr:GNAT family protein [Polyangium aurulentum]UQA63150.1 GNAT family N-acetyltransferase [Polyangium aurulentum]